MDKEDLNISIKGLSRFDKKREKGIMELIFSGFSKYAITARDIMLIYCGNREKFGYGDEVIALNDAPYILGEVDDKSVAVINYSRRYKGVLIISTACALGTMVSLDYTQYLGIEDKEDSLPERHIESLISCLSTYIVTKILMEYSKELAYEYITMFNYITEAFKNNSEEEDKEINSKAIYASIGGHIAYGISVDIAWKDILISKNNGSLYDIIHESEERLKGICDDIVNKKKVITVDRIDELRNLVKRIENNINRSW